MVADVVTSEVLPELEGVVSARPREVVDELVLRDIASLGERRSTVVRRSEVVDPLIFAERFGIVKRRCRGWRGKLRYIVAERRGKGVRLGRREYMRLRHLRIPTRLQRVGVK